MMASNENTARVRTMFGNFDIQETIGQGGMGVVYRARDVTLGRDVALKVLKDELRDNPRVVARFRREAEAVASLDHPRIVQVFSVGAVGKIPYFAMEFIEGKPLNRILRRHKYLQWRPALQVARDVAKALEAAHEAGIIHRDIKPGNILVDRTGNAYVTDFGIAKVLAAETQLTVDGSKLGTPQYMSPERVQSQEITLESDIYSLGVVLFQLLTGRLPYDAHDPVELIRMIVIDPPLRVREYKPDLPEDLERLVAYMIEKKPEDRPRSAGQVVELINRLLDGQSLFDSDSGIDDALDGLREEVSTPHSDSTAGLNSQTVSSLLHRYVLPRWNALPDWARTLLIAGPLIAIAYMGGSVYSMVGGRDSAPDLVRSFSIDQSGWYQQGDFVQFVPEQAGVTLVRLILDGHRAGETGWAGDSAAFVEVVGGDRAGISLMDPATNSASLLVPLGAWHAENVLVDYRPEVGTGLLAQPGSNGEAQLVLADFDPTAGPVNFVPVAQRVIAVAAHPEVNRVATVRQEGRSGRYIEEWTLNTRPPQAEVLFTSQQPVHGLGYSLGGGALVFQEETQAGIETNVVVPGEGRRRLTLGDVRLAAVALNPSAERLLALQQDGDTETGVVFDAVTGSRIVEFGEATDAAWVSDDAAVFLAADASGALQVWRLDLSAAADPVQRTFLDEGVGTRLLVRPSDGVVLVTAANAESVAFVRP